MGEFTRVAVASRAFSLAAILGLQAAISRNSVLTVALMVVGIAAVASYVSFVSAVPSHWVIAGEATFASLAVVAALPDSVLLLPYLVVLPLLAGLARGLRGASLVVVPQLAAISAVAAASGGLDHLRAQAELLAPWALTIAGAGLLGAWARKMGKSPAGSTLDDDRLGEDVLCSDVLAFDAKGFDSAVPILGTRGADNVRLAPSPSTSTIF